MPNASIDLAEFLKREKIGVSGSNMRHGGKRVGTIQNMDGEDPKILVFTQFDSFFRDVMAEESAEIVNVAEPQIAPNNCPRCVDGKCSVTVVKLSLNREEEEKFARKLIKLRCEAIDNNRFPKCNYIKLSDRDKKLPCRKCKKCSPACRSLKNF